MRQRVALILLIGLLISLTINSWLSIQEQARYTNEEINRNGLLVSKIISNSITNSDELLMGSVGMDIPAVMYKGCSR